MFISSIVIGILSFLIYCFFNFILERSSIPNHLINHTVVFRENLISKIVGDSLRKHIKEISVFPSNINADRKAAKGIQFDSNSDNIGEGQLINDDGTCNDPLLIPNHDQTLCVFPQRVDVGKAFISTGGVDGLRENYASLLSRTSSFGAYRFINSRDEDGNSNNNINAAVKTLFKSEKFLQVAREICPADKQVLDPFQYNFIINVPGQTVPLHLDCPIFYGATREQFPQWLLVAMAFSGLPEFQRRYVDQVQIVGYLHEWLPKKEALGDFVFYTKDSSHFDILPSLPSSGIAVDGAKTIHAARTYRPADFLPILSKDKQSNLVYDSNAEGTDKEWLLQVDDETVKTFRWEDLRVTIVYRTRCFKDDKARRSWPKHPAANDSSSSSSSSSSIDEGFDTLSLTSILDIFTKDLISRELLTTVTAASISRLELGRLIQETYIRYPLPDAKIASFPWNYCVLQQVLPSFIAPLFDAIC